MRALGIDLGSRRIGVAVSDATGTLATPLTVVIRSRDVAADHRALAELVRAEHVERVVVGLPLSMSGVVGAAARAAMEEAEALAAVVGVPVETFDERLTTVTADRSLRAARSGARARARREVVDQAAAAVLLQAWLDRASARASSDAAPEGDERR
jgi:putative Holliday junction resolvase